MRKKLTFLIAAGLLLGAVFYAGPMAWSFEKQIPNRIPEDKIFQSFFDDFDKSGTYCEIVNDDSSLGYFFDDFDSGMSFVAYMDPDECTSQPAYPFKITDVHFHLYHTTPTGWSWPVNIQINIREAMGGDKCLGPDPEGTLYSESFAFPVDSSYSRIATGRPINFSLSQYCCVNQPFFLEIRYLDDPQPGDSLPSLLMNALDNPEDTCDNWVYYTHGYDEYFEWYGFWTPPPPGDAIIRATGYTDDADCKNFLWYWKADKPTQDPYPAPSGMPDFDQYQFGGDSVSLCGPTAVANCLWWFNAVPTEPEIMTPPDLIRLLSTYMKCDPHPYGGTYVDSMEIGLDQYFNTYGFDLYEHTYYQPHFHEMEDSLKKSQDIILLLGFYDAQYVRVGGHFVTMAGVCSESLKIAVSDPAKDAAVSGWPGRVRLGDHPGPPVDPTKHNDPSYVSQDIYLSTLESPTSGNPHWGLPDYLTSPSVEFVTRFLGQNFQPGQEPFKGPDIVGPPVYTEVEFAVMICPTTSGVEEEEGGVIPKSFELYQNHPNPFNNETVIKFNLRKPAEVTMTVFNILGQKVRTLAEGRMNAGTHVASWNGKDERGNNLSSGIYFYQLKTGEAKETKRLVLLK